MQIRFNLMMFLAITSLCSAVPALAEPWVRAWAAAPSHTLVSLAPTIEPLFPVIVDKVDDKPVKVRMVVRLSTGGEAVRVRLSNELSAKSLIVSKVTVGRLIKGSDKIEPEQVLRFGGDEGFTVPAGAPAISDALPLNLSALDQLAITMTLQNGLEGVTIHHNALSTTQIFTQSTDDIPSSAPITTTIRYVLSGVDVSRKEVATLVTLGDSITDGASSSLDLNRRWPDVLAQRLQGADIELAIANAGIAGNQLLVTATSPSALARFDRDVVSVPGVKGVVIMIGINDIGRPMNKPGQSLPRLESLQWGIGQLINRGHQAGLKVYLATLTPANGFRSRSYYKPEAETLRKAFNSWIRQNKDADAIIDFDKALADRADPTNIAATYDSSDHLHPSDAGYEAMANAIDVKLFKDLADSSRHKSGLSGWFSKQRTQK
jgi:lysophospholipase L1-like esterase